MPFAAFSLGVLFHFSNFKLIDSEALLSLTYPTGTLNP